MHTAAIDFSTYVDGRKAEPTFTSMRFPAGEAHVKLRPGAPGGPGVTEVARIGSASGDDLMVLAMWADAVRRTGSRMVLLMPYLPGARADHAEFVPLGAQVYADLVNSFGADKVVCFDPHSPTMPGMLENAKVLMPTRLVAQEVVGIAHGEARYQGVIAPDAGAALRAGLVANASSLPLYYAEKVRDPDTGQLSGFACEPLPEAGKFLVVDDICDGGGTFMGLAQATGLPKERLGLYVSHGVFSGKAPQLLDAYGEVWTTDSLRSERAGAMATVIPIDHLLEGAAL